MSVNGKSPTATSTLTVARLDAPAVAALLRDELLRLGPGGGRPLPNWFEFDADLEVAESNAQVGLIVPELSRLRGVPRQAARFLFRMLLLLTRPVSRGQRLFNNSVLKCLVALTARARRVEEDWAVTAHARMAHLDAMLAEQAARIAALERALAVAQARRAG
jgi:hypothetical protein